jgi:hypothetical protein
MDAHSGEGTGSTASYREEVGEVSSDAGELRPESSGLGEIWSAYITETDSEIQVSVEIPGLTRADIETKVRVRFDNGVLTVSLTKSEHGRYLGLGTASSVAEYYERITGTIGRVSGSVGAAGLGSTGSFGTVGGHGLGSSGSSGLASGTTTGTTDTGGTLDYASGLPGDSGSGPEFHGFPGDPTTPPPPDEGDTEVGG